MVSGVFTTTGCWAIQGVAGLERVLEAAGSTAQRRPRYGRRCGRPYRGFPQTINQPTSQPANHRLPAITSDQERSPMPIDAAKALAAEPRTGEITWGHKDVQLYHLG